MTTAFPNGQFFAADGNTPGWLPVPQGNVPKVYADFVNGHYWYNGAAYATLALWLTAVSGTFARTPAATYCGADGLLDSALTGVARFDYDPVTKQPLGIYLEPAFDNSILQSQTFTNAAWTKTHVTATGASSVAPDGTTTGTLLTETGSGSQAHEVAQNLSGNFGCLSVYARAGTSNFLNLAIDDGTSNSYVQAVFDLSQGGVTEYSVGTANAGNINIGSMLIEPAPDFGDGWYHCVLSMADRTSPTAMTYHIGLALAAHGNTYSTTGQALYASGGKTLYVWGAQVPSSPNLPLSYVATTTVAVNGGADKLTLGSAWDNASNPLTILQAYDVRGQSTAAVDSVTNTGYFGVNTDSWVITGPSKSTANQGNSFQGSPNTAATFVNQLPGANCDVFRMDSTTITLSSNGNTPVTSGAGSARTAATSIRIGGYETSVNSVAPMRLRVFAAWTASLSNAALQSLSKLPGVAVPAIASTIDSGDSKFVSFPGFCILPSGYLLADYVRYHSGAQGAKPSQIMYQTAPAPTGSWSAQTLAVANTNSSIDLQAMPLLTLPGGQVLGICNPADFTTLTSGASSLLSVLGTETAPGVMSWGNPVPITGSPFFGTNGAATESGDQTESAPILLPNGKWMLLFYGFQAGASNFTLGAIFTTAPADPTSWTGFTIIADGSVFTPARSFDEANAFIDPSNNIVVVVRQENVTNGAASDYWRVVCPAGADPTVAANWKAPTFMAFDNTIGKPDVLGLGSNGMWMMTRGAAGSNNLVGYNINWNNAASPFPINRAAAVVASLNNRQYWYSQSQLLAGTGFIGTVVGVDNPVAILFLQSQINGIGQSQ